jgi:murein endopeptidase
VATFARLLALVLVFVALSAQTGRIGPAPQHPADDGLGADVAYPPIRWRVSRAVGVPWQGRLLRGVQLPRAGPDWFTWDPVLNRTGNRAWRRWGTDVLLRTVVGALRRYRAADPEAPRVGIMDLSRPHGGWFGRVYGGLGHSSHQNGLDADVMYPRRDERERRPFRPAQVDLERAQELVDRFVAAGAQRVYVGPRLDLHGPRRVVVPLVHHDDHMHVRIPPPPR